MYKYNFGNIKCVGDQYIVKVKVDFRIKTKC